MHPLSYRKRLRSAEKWTSVSPWREVAKLQHTSSVNFCAWSPDGAQVASASDDSVHVFDAITWLEVAMLEGHDEGVFKCDWSPDGCWLATSSTDTTVRVWEVSTWREAAKLEGHADEENCCAWSPDGSRLATASSDNKVCVWLAPASAMTPMLAEADDQANNATVPDSSLEEFVAHARRWAQLAAGAEDGAGIGTGAGAGPEPWPGTGAGAGAGAEEGAGTGAGAEEGAGAGAGEAQAVEKSMEQASVAAQPQAREAQVANKRARRLDGDPQECSLDVPASSLEAFVSHARQWAESAVERSADELAAANTRTAVTNTRVQRLEGDPEALQGCSMVGRCKLPVSKPVLRSSMVSALET